MSIGSISAGNFSSDMGAAAYIKARDNQVTQGLDAIALIQSAEVPQQTEHHDPNSTISVRA